MILSDPHSPRDVILSAIYTLTPTHCGTGQTSGAVDLPIARERYTGLPVLPSSSLKGSARAALDPRDATERKRDWTKLFGPELDMNANETLYAGELTFGEGQLVAFPVRSLNAPFLHVTSPLLIERLQRNLAAFGITGPLAEATIERPPVDGAIVGDDALAAETLVLEDLVFERSAVRARPAVATLGGALGALLPHTDGHTRERLGKGLVIVSDRVLIDLVTRTTPVQARVQLTSAKTTDKVKVKKLGEDGKVAEETESGNLWYEETLPADALFVAFIGRRQQTAVKTRGEAKIEDWSPRDPLRLLTGLWNERHRHVQIGGNETVGQGRCWWTLCDAGDA